MKKISLRTKAILFLLTIAGVLIYLACYVSYLYYSQTMNAYYQEITMNVARTSAALMPAEEILEYRNATLEVFYNEETHAIEDWDEYLEQYTHIMDDRYHELLDELILIRDENNVLYLYVCYMDPVSMTGVYIIDADKSDTACAIGTWDPIYEENYASMQNENQIFSAYMTDTEEYGWLSSAGAPIFSEDGEVVAHVFVDTSVEDMIAARTSFLVQLITLLVLATMISLVIFFYLANRMLISPITTITNETRKFMAQKTPPTEALTKIQTHDELQELSTSVHQMQTDILSYITDLTTITAEKERVATELEVARSIQEGILPCLFPAFPAHIEMDIYATLDPAKEMSGDFYDFFLIDDDYMAMVMADVSGKGVPAALFMMMSRSLIKTTAQTGISPKEVLAKVNNQLCENNEGELFVTVWIGIYQISTGDMVCSNAGHEYPVLARAGGDFELFKDKHGFVLGGMEDMVYTEYTIHMDIGDRIFLYTDGIPEATNAQEELFGNHRMVESLNRYRNHTTREQLEGMREDVNRFVGEAPQFDDITMLVFQREKTE